MKHDMNLINDLLKEFGKHVELYSSENRLYSKDKKCRYYYYKNISEGNDGKKATVIMINPSEKYEDKDIPDNTINNLYEILKEKKSLPISKTKSAKISSFEVINLYSIKNSKFENVIKEPIEELNKNILAYVIDKAEIVVPAWGTEEKFKNNENAETLLKNIKKWCKNKVVLVVTNRYPCHFSTQCTFNNRNPEFIEYKF